MIAKKDTIYILIFFVLLISCSVKEQKGINTADTNTIGFTDPQTISIVKKQLDSISKLPENGAFAFMYMSEAPYTNTNSDFKARIFLANNDMDTLIIYPLSISYAYDTNATQKTPKIGWKPVYVVKDTGYLKIPVKSFPNLSKGNFHAKIVLKLKNNRDSTFTLCLPEIFSRCVK